MEELKEGWKRVKLIDVINFNPKETIKKDEIAKYIEMANLQCFSRKVLGYEAKLYKGGTKFRNGDTVLARITPCLENGKTAYIDCLMDNEVGFGSTEYIILREKEKETNKKFIYYLAISKKFRELAIKSMTGTSGRQRVQLDVLTNSEMDLPPLETQKKIASILSTLDDKIEINNEMNKTLEEMAQTLFKRWFIDFDFPNESGEPYKSSDGKMVDSELGEIPEGWIISKLGEVIDVTDYVANGSFKDLKDNVTLYDEPNEVLYVRTTDYNNGFSGKLKYTDRNSYDFLKKSKLYGKEVIISNVGDVGTVFRPPVWLDLPMTLGSNAVALSFKEYNFYIYYFFKSREGQHCIQSITTGSAQLKFNKTSLRALNILVPNEGILREFKIMEECIFNKINFIKKEIRILTQLRDTFLPKLMNGEIEI